MMSSDRPTQSVETLAAGRASASRRERVWLRRGLLFIACVVAVNALVGERSLSQTLKARTEFARASGDLAGLRLENARLREGIRRLKHDAIAVEGIARGELGLVRRGEILVVVSGIPARQAR